MTDPHGQNQGEERQLRDGHGDHDRTGEPEWHTVQPAGDATMAEAAENIRDAAEYLRDMATPPPAPKERNWDLSWFKDWLKYRPTGRAFKVAVFTTGPAGALFLWYYSREQGGTSGAGMVFILLLLSLVAHWYAKNQFTRTLVFGVLIAPFFYPPALITAVMAIAQVIAGGTK
ncbi:hypothetical protein ACJ6WD_39950 [Streptomyces sp. VTCC 41912]|uniref:hypothetical protein n=1 Tax=Streptomyces sp. VTCC 41912 TaxID=3383243 RepID=UPI003896E830